MESIICNLIDKVKPDFIQVDCKGHPGYSSYPTKVGNPVPGFCTIRCSIPLLKIHEMVVVE